MNIIHPNTKNMLLVSEHSPFVAELEIYPKYQSILIGEVGYSHGLTISYEDWPGFLEFVKEIDVEFNTFGGIGGTQPGMGFPRSGVD